MSENQFRHNVVELIDAADRILPRGVDNVNATQAKLGAMGVVKDTYEWACLRIAALEPSNIKGLLDWYTYLCKQARKKSTRLYIETLEAMLCPVPC